MDWRSDAQDRAELERKLENYRGLLLRFPEGATKEAIRDATSEAERRLSENKVDGNEARSPQVAVIAGSQT
jgi:hypothetical protein